MPELSVQITANRRYVEIALSEESTTVSFLLDAEKTATLTGKLQRSLERLRQNAHASPSQQETDPRSHEQGGSQ